MPDLAQLAELNPAILTNTLKVFTDQFLYGYGRIHNDALTLLKLLALIDLALAAIMWLLARSVLWADLAQKILAYAFWIWLVTAWITLMPTIIDGFVYIGLKAGGSTMTVKEFTNPGKIAQLGLVATEPIWRHIRNYGWNAAWNL